MGVKSFVEGCGVLEVVSSQTIIIHMKIVIISRVHDNSLPKEMIHL